MVVVVVVVVGVKRWLLGLGEEETEEAFAQVLLLLCAPFWRNFIKGHGGGDVLIPK